MAFNRFDKEYILRKGFVDVKAIVTGLRQTHRLKVVKEKSSQGWVTLLEGRYSLPESEMVRLAEELQFPIRTKGVTVYPKGKMQGDFTTPYTEEEKTRFADELAKLKAEDEAEEEAEEESEDEEDEEEAEDQEEEAEEEKDESD